MGTSDNLKKLDARIQAFKSQLAADGVIAKDWAKWDAEHPYVPNGGRSGVKVSVDEVKHEPTDHPQPSQSTKSDGTPLKAYNVTDGNGNQLGRVWQSQASHSENVAGTRFSSGKSGTTSWSFDNRQSGSSRSPSSRERGQEIGRSEALGYRQDNYRSRADATQGLINTVNTGKKKGF